MLDIRINQIGNEGGAAIAEALKVNRSLMTLYLGENGIDEEGAVKIAEALTINDSLTTLDLTDNQISDEGAAIIAEALKVNSSLTTVDLSLNKIGEKGIIAISNALKTPGCSLTILGLSCTNISKVAGEALIKALTINTRIQKLKVGIDMMNPDQWERIQAILRPREASGKLTKAARPVATEEAGAAAALFQPPSPSARRFEQEQLTEHSQQQQAAPDLGM